MCEETKASMEKHTGCTGIALTCLYTSSSLPVIFFNLLLECVFFFFGAQVVPLSLTDLSKCPFARCRSDPLAPAGSAVFWQLSPRAGTVPGWEPWCDVHPWCDCRVVAGCWWGVTPPVAQEPVSQVVGPPG